MFFTHSIYLGVRMKFLAAIALFALAALAGKFGDEFREHERNTGFLLPKFSGRER